MSSNEDSFFILLEYSFTASLGAGEADRFINEYQVKIKAISLDDESEQIIGKANVSLVLAGLALNYKYEIFDWSQNLLQLGETIYDFDSNDYKEELQQHFNYEILDSNILFIERLELLPEFRGKGIGKKVLKVIIERFSGCCGLIALKAFPIQFENASDEDSEWYKKLTLHELEQDEEKAKYLLYSYYQSLGFSQPFNDGYFFINPAWKNEMLDKIELD